MNSEREEENSVRWSTGDISVGDSPSGIYLSGGIESAGSTASPSNVTIFRIIRYSFEKYDIDVIVDSDNKFVGISEVSIKRDFLSPNQRMALRSHIDADEYYRE